MKKFLVVMVFSLFLVLLGGCSSGSYIVATTMNSGARNRNQPSTEVDSYQSSINTESSTSDFANYDSSINKLFEFGQTGRVYKFIDDNTTCYIVTNNINTANGIWCK